MQALVLCNKGIEELVSLDIKEILSQKSKTYSGYVIFDIEKKEDLCTLTYISQSISKSLLLLNSFKFKNEEDLLANISETDFNEWISSKTTFRVDSLATDSEISAESIRGIIGEFIVKNTSAKVDLDNPGVIVFIFINGNIAFLGIDFSGIDLSKREYRIFSSPKNIKATLAYAMVRLSGFKKGEKLLDPFCLSGSISIEAALYENNFPPHFFEKDALFFNKFVKLDFAGIDKKRTENKGSIYALDSLFKNVDAAKKNAKIANVNKAITFSRLNIEWLDTKFDKETVDKIVTCMPNITNQTNLKSILKLYKEFFYQAEFILKKEGAILVCTKNPEEVKKEAIGQKFKLVDEKEVWQGKEKMFFVKFSK